MKKFAVTILLLMTAASVGIVILISWNDYLTGVLGAEGYKILLQFLLITVLGGLVSSTLAEYKLIAEKSASRRAHLKEFYDRVLFQYNKSKRVRRDLRSFLARLESQEAKIVTVQLAVLIGQLQDIQLEFETYRRQARLQRSTLPKANELTRLLEKIEHSHRLVTKEYENGAEPTGPSNQAPQKLLAFVNEQKNGGIYLTEIAIPFEEIEEILLSAIEKDA